MSFLKKFRVKPGERKKLGKIDPNFTGKYVEDRGAYSKLEENGKELTALQDRLYAENKQSLLIVLQGLDTAGKDGTINHALGALNPQGTKVYGFKAPSEEEAAHDFLWRAHSRAPARGEIAIFNRSYYEDVLVIRVHKIVPKEVIAQRYELINDFEKNLRANGTRILKFYLHISQDEQLRRFKKRLDDSTKNWKISESDYAERKFWPQYEDAYESTFKRTSTKDAPWFIIPSNNKWFRDLAVSKIVIDAMEDMKMKIPKPKVDLDKIRRKYHSEEVAEKRLLKPKQEE